MLPAQATGSTLAFYTLIHYSSQEFFMHEKMLKGSLFKVHTKKYEN